MHKTYLLQFNTTHLDKPTHLPNNEFLITPFLLQYKYLNTTFDLTTLTLFSSLANNTNIWKTGMSCLAYLYYGFICTLIYILVLRFFIVYKDHLIFTCTGNKQINEVCGKLCILRRGKYKWNFYFLGK